MHSLDTPCVLWTGSTVKGGYGRSHGVLVHKREWEKVHGLVPDGLELGHLCETPRCYRVDHLKPMTRSANELMKYVGRTHCRNGHPEERNHKGECRACIRAASARYAARKRS